MKKYILLIDDDEDELKIFTEALSDTKILYDCVHVQSAELAIHMLDQFRPDYIFVDLNMPRIDGLNCLSKIRQKPFMKDTPVFLYSNCITDGTRQKANELGASACIQKPDSIDALSNVLRTLLHKTTSIN